jgi:hypothetical protein
MERMRGTPVALTFSDGPSSSGDRSAHALLPRIAALATQKSYIATLVEEAESRGARVPLLVVVGEGLDDVRVTQLTDICQTLSALTLRPGVGECGAVYLPYVRARVEEAGHAIAAIVVHTSTSAHLVSARRALRAALRFGHADFALVMPLSGIDGRAWAEKAFVGLPELHAGVVVHVPRKTSGQDAATLGRALDGVNVTDDQDEPVEIGDLDEPVMLPIEKRVLPAASVTIPPPPSKPVTKIAVKRERPLDAPARVAHVALEQPSAERSNPPATSNDHVSDDDDVPLYDLVRQHNLPKAEEAVQPVAKGLPELRNLQAAPDGDDDDDVPLYALVRHSPPRARETAEPVARSRAAAGATIVGEKHEKRGRPPHLRVVIGSSWTDVYDEFITHVHKLRTEAAEGSRLLHWCLQCHPDGGSFLEHVHAVRRPGEAITCGVVVANADEAATAAHIAQEHKLRVTAVEAESDAQRRFRACFVPPAGSVCATHGVRSSDVFLRDAQLVNVNCETIPLTIVGPLVTHAAIVRWDDTEAEETALPAILSVFAQWRSTVEAHRENPAEAQAACVLYFDDESCMSRIMARLGNGGIECLSPLYVYGICARHREAGAEADAAATGAAAFAALAYLMDRLKLRVLASVVVAKPHSRLMECARSIGFITGDSLKEITNRAAHLAKVRGDVNRNALLSFLATLRVVRLESTVLPDADVLKQQIEVLRSQRMRPLLLYDRVESTASLLAMSFVDAYSDGKRPVPSSNVAAEPVTAAASAAYSWSVPKTFDRDTIAYAKHHRGQVTLTEVSEAAGLAGQPELRSRGIFSKVLEAPQPLSGENDDAASAAGSHGGGAAKQHGMMHYMELRVTRDAGTIVSRSCQCGFDVRKPHCRHLAALWFVLRDGPGASTGSKQPAAGEGERMLLARGP